VVAVKPLIVVYPSGIDYHCSESDVLFFKLDPIAGRHCGLTKVVLQGTLKAVQWFIGGPGTGPIPVWSANIANITIAIHIPWFLRG